jgi:hypothetical protein
MTDGKGNTIAVGDEVVVRARIARLWEGEPGHLRNVQLDAGCLLHSSQVERVGPPAPPPVVPAPETDESRLRDWLAQYRSVWSGPTDDLPRAWYAAYDEPLPPPANGQVNNGGRVISMHDGGRVVVTSPYGAEIRAL